MAQNNPPPEYAKVEPFPYNGQMSLQEYDQNKNQQGQWANSNYQDQNQQLFAPPPPIFQVSSPNQYDNNYMPQQGNNTNSTAPPVFAPPPSNYVLAPPIPSDAQQQYYNNVPKQQIMVYEYDKYEYKPQEQIQYNNVEQQIPLLPPAPDDELPVGQMSNKGKKNFLIKITALWDLQLIIQIILCYSIYVSESFDGFFFDYGTQRHKFTLYFFLMTTIILFLVIRFVKVFRTNNKYAFPMFCVFTLSYALFAAGCASGLNQMGLENLRLLPFIAIIYLIVQILSAFSLTILILTFFLWKDEPQFRQYSPRLIIGPTLLSMYLMIFQKGNSYFSLLLFYATSACWLLYFLHTVFKILNGKFNLHKNDYVIGCLLTYCQMIIPEW